MATKRQDKAAKLVARKGLKVSQAMKEAGYAPSTAASTTKLTASPEWPDLLNKYLPDNNLVSIHKGGLGATKKTPVIVGRDKKGAPVYDYQDIPDWAARHKYLTTAYRLKQRYPTNAPLQVPTTLIQIIQQINNKTPSDIEEAQ